MKIFLDTADSKAIEKWSDTGLIDGVTTNPTHLSKSGSPKKTVLAISKLLPRGDISVEITHKKAQDVYKQAKAIAKLAKNIVVKIPCHRDYFSVIHKLVQEKIKLNITLVFTPIQAMLMCKLGVKYISPFVGRWDDIDVDGAELLEQLRHMIDQYDFKTEILAASLRTVRNVDDAIMAGADVITVPPALLEKVSDHILTNQGIARFDADWKKLGIKTFP